MADSTLHIVPDPATRTLADELQAMRDKCVRMEDALIAADAILRTILSEGMVDHLPAEEKHHDAHNRAVVLVAHARDLINRTVDDFMECPPSLDLRDLISDASEGLLQRSPQQ